MTKKHTFEDVSKFIDSIGYSLIEDFDYKNNMTKFKVKCTEGHVYETTFSYLRSGNMCKRCACKKIASKNIATFDEVKSYIESFGYKLLSDEYVNSTKKIEVMCDKGHKYKTTYAVFKSGHRCKVCSNKKSSEKRKLDFKYIKEYVESFNYKLISTKYKNSGELLDMICDKGHECKISWDNFKYGRRCVECRNEATAERCKHSYKYVKSYIEDCGYSLLSKDYQNENTYLTIKCEKGHIFKRHFASFKVTHRCPICGMSKGENKVKLYLESINKPYIFNKPYFDDLLSPKGNPLRPDFILEDDKVWIEYDGEFHYKIIYDETKYISLKQNDEIKNEYAKKHNWKMIRIPYWEFDNIEKILNRELNITRSNFND